MAHPKYTDHSVKLESYELGNKFFQKLADNLLRISTLSEEANEFLRLPNTTDKLLLKNTYMELLYFTLFYIFTFSKMSVTLFSSLFVVVFSV